MKKNLEKTLVEMFGDPIDPKLGTKIGQLPGITTVGAVGVRDMGMNDDLGDVCQNCGMMSIDGKCGCEEMPEEHHDSLDSVCSSCSMMSPSIEAPSCGCLSTGEEMLEEKTCSECGMNESVCECGYMSEAKKKVQVRKLQRKFFVEQRPLHKK